MKKIYFVALLFVAFSQLIFAKTINITNNGNAFTPAAVTAEVGDIIIYTKSGSHTFTQVDKKTWDANGTDALNGGFDFQNTNGQFTVEQKHIGELYYVCQFHMGSAMKGMITVSGTTGIEDNKLANPDFNVYPNPTTGILKFNTPGFHHVEVYNMLGVEVLELFSETGSVDLAALPQGVYLVRFRKEGNVFVKRVIKK